MFKTVVTAIALVFGMSTAMADDLVRIGSTKGTGNYQHAASIAKKLTELGIQAAPAPHNDQSDYTKKVNDGELELAQGNLIELTMAYYAEMHHTGKPPQNNLRMVGKSICLFTGYIVGVDSGINTYADLKGKKIGSGWNGRPTLEALNRSFLRNGNLTWDDINKVPVTGIVESWKLYKQDLVDATIAALGAGSMKPVNAAKPSKVLPFDTSSEDIVNKTFGSEFRGYEMVRVKPGKWEPMVREEMDVMCVPYMIYTHVNADEKRIYEIAKALAKAEFDAPFMSTFDKNKVATTKNGIPFHPGALKAYKELGLIKE